METQTGISDKITELDLLSFCLELSFAHIELSLSHATLKTKFKIRVVLVSFSAIKFFQLFVFFFYFFLKKMVNSPECAQALESVSQKNGEGQ
jgi:hypothetical protein